jgi:hypothetical protein
VNPVRVTVGTDASFVVTASPAPAQPLTVLYTVAGTAVLNVDYTLDGPSQQVVIPAGQGSATVHMHATTGPTGRRGETVKLQLTGNAAYKTPRRGGKAATVRIIKPAG